MTAGERSARSAAAAESAASAPPVPERHPPEDAADAARDERSGATRSHGPISGGGNVVFFGNTLSVECQRCGGFTATHAGHKFCVHVTCPIALREFQRRRKPRSNGPILGIGGNEVDSARPLQRPFERTENPPLRPGTSRLRVQDGTADDEDEDSGVADLPIGGRPRRTGVAIGAHSASDDEAETPVPES